MRTWFKIKPPKEKMKCAYCGENYGQMWINDPNEVEPKIENCWWVCVTCDKMIELQGQQSMVTHLIHSAEEEGFYELLPILKRKEKDVENKILDLAHEDGQEVACFEVKKEGKGYRTNRKY